MKPNPEDKNLVQLIDSLEQDKKAMWKRVSELLNKSKRTRVEVNVSKIAKFAKEGITIIVQGKVLGEGTIEVPVVVAASRFSKSAIYKIENSGGKAIPLLEFYNNNKDKPKDIVIIT